MTPVQKSIEVDVPVNVAYNQWTQFEEFPRFMDGVEEVQQIDDTHLRWRAEIAGQHREWEAEITEQVPDHRIAWQATSGKRNSGVVEFEPLGDDRTRISLSLDVETEGIIEKAGEKMGAIDTQIEEDLGRFKNLIESLGVETGAWRGTV